MNNKIIRIQCQIQSLSIQGQPKEVGDIGQRLFLSSGNSTALSNSINYSNLITNSIFL